MKKFFAVFLLICACGAVYVSAQEEKKEDAPERKLSPGKEYARKHQQEIRARMEKDAMSYSREERDEIEKLYQLWRIRKGKEKQAVAITIQRRFPKANLTGCVMLNIALDNARQRRIDLLKQVIRDYDDCRYFGGVPVGALARYHLAKILKETGKSEEAEKYREELKASFPDAIDGAGRPLAELLDD